MRCELHSDDRAAANHHHQAFELAERADALWKPPDNVETGMGEVVPAKPGRVADTLKTPDVVALDASAHRIELLDHMGNDCLALALDAAASANAENSLERMLCHQLAVAHKLSLEIIGRLPFEPDSVGQVRLLNGAARMLDTFQRGLLVLQRLRTGGEQTIVVRNVTVGEGGQAIVGNVGTGEKKK